MTRIALIFLSISLLLNTLLEAAPKNIATAPMLDKASSAAMEDKPQIAKDLEGLDPKEGGISQGLRGSFIVKHYISGPWAGGTAVIEVASDLSYAEIRIFNADQNLQRVYSIQPKAQSTRINPAQMQNPIRMVEQVRADDAAHGRAEPANVARSPAREAAVQAQTERAVEAEKREREETYETRVRPGTISNRAGDIREVSPPAREAAAVQPSAPRETAVAAAPKKRIVRVRKKRPRKSRSTLDTPLSGAPAPAEYEYYYEEVVVWDKPKAEKVPSQEPVKVAKAEPLPPPPPAVPRARPAKGSVVMAEPTPVRAPTTSPATSVGTAAYDETGLPDVAEAVSENEKESAQPSSKDSSAQSKEEREREKAREKREEARESKREEARKREEPREPEPVAVPPVQEPPKPVQVVALPGTPVPAIKAIPQEEPVIEDLKEAQKAAAKLESDSWSPKTTAAARPSDAELGITDMEKASSRRGSQQLTRQPGQTEDDMVAMSDDVKRGGQVGAGDSWSPTASAPKLSPTEARAQALLNNLKTPQAGRPAKLNRDVNNPEEGVMPFYSLEKYSGSQYGRHREFERKVVYKQNGKSPVKGYDFYMDEVDRKEEKHYLYYYKIDPKTKKAKLIATEKHERVTFLSNYDIGSEDKGKIKYE